MVRSERSGWAGFQCMRAGKELILATKPFAEEQLGRSWRLFLGTVALLALALWGTLVEIPLPMRAVSSVLAGLLTVRLFVIYHDFEHHAILRKSSVADCLMAICGIYCLAAPSVWKSSHDYHHTHNSKLRTAHIGSFPIMTRSGFEQASRAERFAYLFARHPLTILFGYLTIFLAGMCLLPFLRSPRKHFDCLLALVLHLGLATTLFAVGGWLDMILFLIAPHFIASAAGAYLFYAQHNFPQARHYAKSEWSYAGAALESSSFMRMPRWLHWFTANIGYHHLHHLNARIPFYRLPEAMSELPEAQTPRSTSLSPAEVIRCLRLKFWDPEAGRMVGWRG
jgi:omega-6 fatty acid desaturase (delta-12 desaturase)